MKTRRSAKLLTYVISLNFLSIIFALIIEKSIDLLVKAFNMSLKMEVLILISVILIGILFMYLVYRQIYSLMTFEPISKQIFSENEKKAFYELMLKVKNKETLTDYQKKKLQLFIDKSPLPSDFVQTYSNRLYFNLWEKFVLIILGLLLMISLRKRKHESN